MIEKYIQNSLEVFVEDLASSKSTPGGGSVSALVGLNAVALILMVLRISQKKKIYREFQKEIQESIQRVEQLKEQFKQKIDEDIRIFRTLLSAYKKQKGAPLNSQPKKENSNDLPSKVLPTEKNMEASTEQILEETVDFCFSVLEDGMQALKFSMELTRFKNSLLASDVAMALVLSFATMECAQMNVQINLRSLSPRNPKRIEIQNKMQTLLEEGKKIKEQGLESTYALLMLPS